jgi:hypothetical protein
MVYLLGFAQMLDSFIQNHFLDISTNAYCPYPPSIQVVLLPLDQTDYDLPGFGDIEQFAPWFLRFNASSQQFVSFY